jgi:hypothetical protein
MFDIAHPEGRMDALTGFPLPADDIDAPGDLSDLERRMKLGDAFLIGAPERGLWRLEVHDGGSLPQPPAELWIPPHPSTELAERFERGRFNVLLQLVDTTAQLGPVVLYGTELADRIARLAEGAVQDLHAQRAFAPGEWRVPDRIGELDAREHISVHQIAEAETHWIHTHGLIKFGRPEFEVYDVADELAPAVSVGFLDLAQYVMEGGLIEPGHTLGDPDVPLRTRVGERELDHWTVPVLELVDGGRGQESSAERGLRAWLAQYR